MKVRTNCFSSIVIITTRGSPLTTVKRQHYLYFEEIQEVIGRNLDSINNICKKITNL